MTGRPTVAIAMDIDGVVSPIDGPTTFGDDHIAGHMLGPVPVSPTLTRRLDAIAGHPDVTAVWLTTWPASNRLTMIGFPGRDWPDLKPPPAPAEAADPDQWWKPVVLRRWVDAQPQLRLLIWCDDDILPPLDELQPLTGRLPSSAQRIVTSRTASPILELMIGDLPAALFVPDTHHGLTSADLDRIEGLIAG